MSEKSAPRAVVSRTDTPGRWTVTVAGETKNGRLRSLQAIADRIAGEPTVLVWPDDIAEKKAGIAEADRAIEAAKAAAAQRRAGLASYLRGDPSNPDEKAEDIGVVLGGVSRQRVAVLLQQADR